MVAQKLLFQVIYGWAEPKAFTHVIEDETKPLSDEEREQLDKAVKSMEKLTIMRYERQKQQEQSQQSKAPEQPVP